LDCDTARTKEPERKPPAQEKNTDRHAEILELLRKRVTRAQERRMVASIRFDDAMRIPSGIQGTDGALALKEASLAYCKSLEVLHKAIQEQNDFLLRGAIPSDFGED
jgi:hypothetical protein